MLLILDEEYEIAEIIGWLLLWSLWLFLVCYFDTVMQFLAWCNEVWEAVRRRLGVEAAHPQVIPSGDNPNIPNTADGDNRWYRINQNHGYGDVPTS